jgi:hypothetical protein
MRTPVAVGGGKASKGRTASRGSPVRAGRKRDEPQDRQRDATGPHGRGGGSRRGGEKPRGRNVDGRVAALVPKVGWRHPAGSGLRAPRRWRGDLWTTPGEETRHFGAGSRGPGGAGKDGTKVRRVAHKPMQVEACGPVEGPSRARMRKRPKAVEGGGEGQPSHDFDRVFPPRDASRQTGCRARTLRRRGLGDELCAPVRRGDRLLRQLG